MPLNPTNLFAGKLVHLAATTSDDMAAFARWSNDADYLRHLDSDPARPRSADYFTKDMQRREEHNNNFNFMIRTLADDKTIGFVALWTEWSHQTAMLAIGIGEPDYRGKGYGSDALQVILRYGFWELNLYRIGLNVFSYNERAIHTYEKAGFRHEGRLRGLLARDGQRFDLIYMGILREEWLSRQENVS